MTDLSKMTWADRNAIGDYLIRYAWTFLGINYKYGGDDPMEGLDCSGLNVELLKAVGMMGEKEDLTAEGLKHKFAADIIDKPKKPCLVFWVDDKGHAYHTALYVGEGFIIEAGGGDSVTTDIVMAKKKNAFIKLRHLSGKAPVIYCDFLQLRRMT